MSDEDSGSDHLLAYMENIEWGVSQHQALHHTSLYLPLKSYTAVITPWGRECLPPRRLYHHALSLYLFHFYPVTRHKCTLLMSVTDWRISDPAEHRGKNTEDPQVVIKINFFMGDSSNLIPPHTRTHGGTNNYKIPLRNSNSDLAQPEREAECKI